MTTNEKIRMFAESAVYSAFVVISCESNWLSCGAIAFSCALFAMSLCDTICTAIREGKSK